MIRCDDLEIRNYKIYQETEGFCFGIDAVLLANFVLRNIKTNNRINICDLCSGNIIVPLILYSKRKNDMNITAIDINEKQMQLAKESLLLNKKIDENIENDIKLINDDIKNILIDKNKYKNEYSKYDIISINPPYIKNGGGIKNNIDDKIIARHEVKINFDDICKISYQLLKSKKSLFVIHRSNRLSEIICTLKKNNLEPKQIQMIHPYVNKESNLVLIEAVKDANEETKILQPIIIYEKENIYTKDVLNIYGK